MVRVTFHKLQTTKSPPGPLLPLSNKVDNGVLILGGGRANDGSSNGQPAFVHFCDAWFLDPQDAQWRELAIESPFTARRGHSALLHERRLVVFGGVADSGAGGPVERLIEGDQQLVVFDVDDAVTRLSRVSPDVSGAPPRPRRAHAAWLSGHTMLVYGGFMQTLQEIQEGVLDAIDAASALHALNLETWTWSRVDARPPMRPPAAVGGRDASEEWARRASRESPSRGAAPSKARPCSSAASAPRSVSAAAWPASTRRGSGPCFGTPGRGATSRRRRLDAALLAGLCGVRRPLRGALRRVGGPNRSGT